MSSIGHCGNDLWVFGYGSLIWRPGFDYCEAHAARITGFQRAFCVYSTHHRGNERQPGLVLGLKRGGACEGIAFRVRAAKRDETIRYLRAREQISGVYRETDVQVQILGRGQVELAMTFMVETAHPNYAGHLPFLQQVHIIRNAHGCSGPNVEYLVNTSMHLRELAIRDRKLERLATAAGGLFAASFNKPHALYRRAACLAALKRGPVAAGPKLHQAERRRFLYRNRLG